MTCLICNSTDTKQILKKQSGPLKDRIYYLCKNCDLIFVPRFQHLSLSTQKPYYDTHDNGPHQDGYVQFLSQILKPLIQFLDKNAKGLDYGCGPGPTLDFLFKKNGFDMECFDPLYLKNTKALTKTYDFITATEVVEHFSDPFLEFKKLKELLKPNGHFGIMTQFYESLQNFQDWWYHRDPTHICFYNQKTFEVLAERLSFEILFCKKPVVVLKKSS